MGRLELNRQQTARRRQKIRSQIIGTATKPRLSVKIGNKNVYAQLIDDENGKTLASANSLKSKAKTMSAKCEEVGCQIGELGTKAKIESAVLDRSGKRFHGNIKLLTEKANEKGLKV